jgi:hypothetical protein
MPRRSIAFCLALPECLGAQVKSADWPVYGGKNEAPSGGTYVAFSLPERFAR